MVDIMSSFKQFVSTRDELYLGRCDSDSVVSYLITTYIIPVFSYHFS